MPSLGQIYLSSAIKRLAAYKDLGDKTFAQLTGKDLFFTPDPGSNSIAIIIRHLSGNMISRWTNFLTEDGEKPWRNRETEFGTAQTPDAPEQLQTPETREELIESWEKGWSVLFNTLQSLTEQDLTRTIHIRHEPLIAIDAINRQIAHYPHHVGQIVYIGKMLKGKDWISLSIPKGGSEQFNSQMEKEHKNSLK